MPESENGHGRPDVTKLPAERVVERVRDIVDLVRFGKESEVDEALDGEQQKARAALDSEGVGPTFAGTQERSSLLYARKMSLWASEALQDGGQGEEYARDMRGQAAEATDEAKVWGKLIEGEELTADEQSFVDGRAESIREEAEGEEDPEVAVDVEKLGIPKEQVEARQQVGRIRQELQDAFGFALPLERLKLGRRTESTGKWQELASRLAAIARDRRKDPDSFRNVATYMNRTELALRVMAPDAETRTAIISDFTAGRSDPRSR